MPPFNLNDVELKTPYQSLDLKEVSTMTAVDIIQNITTSFSTFLEGTGSGIVGFFETIFTNGEGNISILGIVGLSMIGLGFATAMVKKLLNRV